MTGDPFSNRYEEAVQEEIVSLETLWDSSQPLRGL